MNKKKKEAEQPKPETARILVCHNALELNSDSQLHGGAPLGTNVRFNKRIANNLFISLDPIPDDVVKRLVDQGTLNVHWMARDEFLRIKRRAFPIRTYDLPLQRKRDTFHSLMKVLDGHFDKPFDTLPPRAKVRVLRDFDLRHWNAGDEAYRRKRAERWDDERDPANEARREREWHLVCKDRELESKIVELESMAVHTPLEMESKARQLKALREQVAIVSEELRRLFTPPSGSSGATARGERDCKEWLLALMKSGDKAQKSKLDYRAEAIKKFDVSVRGFNRVWGESVRVPENSKWKKPGRKPTTLT